MTLTIPVKPPIQAGSSWPLYNAVRQCTDCHLVDSCLAPVPGIGPIDATVMFVGEAPGEHEDEDGVPFTGAAGTMLDEMIEYIGLSRSSVFITNCVRCRPRNNATPKSADLHYCADKWLANEIKIIKPTVIVAMGQTAIRYLLDDDSLTVEHTHAIPHWREIDGHTVLIFPTYHPAAGLYTTSQLRMVFDDFRTLGLIMNGANPNDFVPVDQYPKPIYTEVKTVAHARALLSQPMYSLDTETVPDSQGVSRLWSVQISTTPGEAWFIPASLIPDPMTAIPSTTTVWVHNYLYDEQFIHMPKFVDTMIMAYLLGLPQGLKQLAFRLCGMEMSSYDEYVGQYRQARALGYLRDAEWRLWPQPDPMPETKWDKKVGGIVEKNRNPNSINKKVWKILDDYERDPSTDCYSRWQVIDSRERVHVEAELGLMLDASLEQVPHDEAVYYSSRDADATIRIKPELEAMIRDRNLDFVLHAVDLPTLPAIKEMMDEGMPINRQHFIDLSLEYTARLNVSAVRCANAGGFGPFNPNSPIQVADLVYGSSYLGFPVTKLTDGGLPSTDDRELKKVDHPVIEEILEYRRLLKIKTSYADVLPEIAVDDEWSIPRVHGTLKPTRTETGRLSATDPNLQAMPVRHAEGRRIRDGFEAPPGFVFVAADYSQIEMRQLAHATQSKHLLQLFWDDLDIHTYTASVLFKIDYETAKQTKYRYPTKRINFGIVYGITAKGLYEGLIEEGIEGWTLRDCEELLVTYDHMFPEVKQYRQAMINHARKWGFVVDFVGRMRFIPELFCPIRRIRAEGERAAGNMPIQGGAQAIIKLATNKLKKLRDEGQSPVPFKILLQVHDELIFEVAEFDVARFTEWLKPIMESIVKLSVPLVCTVKVGKTWGSLE